MPASRHFFFLLKNCKIATNRLHYILNSQGVTVSIVIDTGGRDSVLSTATRYMMDVSGLELRCREEILSSKLVETGPGAHPASYKTDTGALHGGKVAQLWRQPPNPMSRRSYE